MMMETVPSATGICLRQMAFFDRVDGLISTPRHGSMICRQLSIIKASVLHFALLSVHRSVVSGQSRSHYSTVLLT